jgi:hypothetical protein
MTEERFLADAKCYAIGKRQGQENGPARYVEAQGPAYIDR